MRFVFFFHFRCVIFFGIKMICLMSFYNKSWDLQTKFPFYFRSQNNHFSFIHYSVGDGFFLRFQASYFFKDHLMCFIFWIRLLECGMPCWFSVDFLLFQSLATDLLHIRRRFDEAKVKEWFFHFLLASAFFSSFRFLLQFRFLQKTRQISLFVLKPKQYTYKMVLTLNLWIKLYRVTIQMKATEQYGYPVELHKVVRKAFFSVTIQIKGTEPYLPVVLFIKGPKIRRWLQ